MASINEDVDYSALLTNSKANYNPLVVSSRLLGVQPADVKDMLLTRKVKIQGRVISKRLDCVAASRRRDAIAKHVYSSLFDWLVLKLNENMHGVVAEGNEEYTSIIGVLDVFGFEEFTKNGFEQLLINYANEVLLSLFTREILIGENEIYKAEGLIFNDSEVTGVDEAASKYSTCLSLFEGEVVNKKKILGLFSTLNSQGKVPDPTDDKLLQQFHKSYSKNPYYVMPHATKRRECFIIKHYANTVTYTVGTFLEKNDQSLPANIEKVFEESTHEIVRNFHFVKNVKEGGSGFTKSTIQRAKTTKKTVCSTFTRQMTELKETLLNTGCSYIRCIKPNPTLYFNPEAFRIESAHTLGNGTGNRRTAALTSTQRKFKLMNEEKGRKITTQSSKKPLVLKNKYFDESYISAQLKNLGIYDCVDVLKSGFPTRIPYPTFIDTYSEIIPLDRIPYFKQKPEVYRNKLYVSALMSAFSVPREGYKLGNTKIFFRNGHLDDVKQVLKNGLTMARTKGKSRIKKKIVPKFKRFYGKKRWHLALAAVRTAILFKNLYLRVHSARVIQRFFKKTLFKKTVLTRIRERRAAVIIQKIYRARLAKKVMKKLRRKKAEEDAKSVIARIDRTLIKAQDNPRLAVSGSQATRFTEMSTFSPNGTDSIEFQSTFSSEVCESNAMRGTLLGYFNRRTSYNRSVNSGAMSTDGIDDPQYEEFVMASKLSNADSLFNFKTVKDATDDEWRDVDFIFSEFDGPDAEPEMLDDLDDPEIYDDIFDEEELLEKEKFEASNDVLDNKGGVLRNVPTKLTELTDINETDVETIYLNPRKPSKKSSNIRRRRKTTLREPKSLKESVLRRKKERHQPTLKPSRTNVSTATTFSLSEDNFADVMLETLKDAEGLEKSFEVEQFNMVKLSSQEVPNVNDDTDKLGEQPQPRKKPSIQLPWRKHKSMKQEEIQRVDNWKRDKNHVGKRKTGAKKFKKHDSRKLEDYPTSTGDVTEDDDYKVTDNPPPASAPPNMLKQFTMERKDSAQSLLEEANDKKSNFVKRMAAMWGTAKRPAKKKSTT